MTEDKKVNLQNENNQVEISGIIASEPKFLLELKSEKFYEFFVRIERTSGVADVLPVTVSERLTDITKSSKSMECIHLFFTNGVCVSTKSGITSGQLQILRNVSK